jgi:hypothetical protein
MILDELGGWQIGDGPEASRTSVRDAKSGGCRPTSDYEFASRFAEGMRASWA